jgi:hypothetical protein
VVCIHRSNGSTLGLGKVTSHSIDFALSSYSRIKEKKRYKLSESYSVDFQYQEVVSDVMDEELQLVFEFINNKLKEDLQIPHLLPIDPRSIQSCWKAVKDGTLLW